MGRKENLAMSGMHMPSGQNMWVNVSDDLKFKKDALGILDIPKESPVDYNFEQSPHSIDQTDHGIGVLDKDSYVDNNLEDMQTEKDMQKILDDLISELDKKGYNKLYSIYSKFIKNSQKKYSDSELKYDYAIRELKTEIEKWFHDQDRERILYAINSLLYNSTEFDIEQKRLNDDISTIQLNLAQSLKDIIEKESLKGKKDPSNVYAVRNAYNTRYKDLVEKLAEAWASVVSEKMIVEIADIKPEQVDKQKNIGWKQFILQSQEHAKMAETWQQSPPQGYTKDYQSFVDWYKKKSAERKAAGGSPNFGPAEAITLMEADKAGTASTGNILNGEGRWEGQSDESKPAEDYESIQFAENSQNIKEMSNDITVQIETAIKNMQTRNLKFNTPFIGERRQMNRWVRKFYDNSVRNAAEAVRPGLSDEQWNALIEKNYKAMNKNPVNIRGTQFSTLSGEFYNTIYNLLKQDILKRKRQ